jgi:hypothetical protein
MTDWAPTARDERRHVRGPSEWWGESWGFEFGDGLSEVGMFVRFVIHPNRNTCWFWAAVVNGADPVVLCRDLSVPMPAQPSVLEIRSSALWSHAICETPFDHWTVAMEAYAVSLDDPNDAYTGEFGDRVGLAFDLEWEDSEKPTADATKSEVRGYAAEGKVTGVLQLDDLTIDVTASGCRDHVWGDLPPEWFADRMNHITEGDPWIGWLIDDIASFPPVPLARSFRKGVWM